MAPFEPDRDTRRLLLEKARDLLLAEGLGGFSLRKVAALAGLSPAAVYRHFEDKDELLSGAVQAGSSRFISYLTSALTAKTPRERLRRLGQRYYDFAVENRADYELIFVFDCARLGLEKLDEKARQDSGASFRLLVDRVVECQHSGDVRRGPPEELAVSIWAGIHGLVALLLSGHLGVDDASAGALFRSHQEVLLRGVSP